MPCVWLTQPPQALGESSFQQVEAPVYRNHAAASAQCPPGSLVAPAVRLPVRRPGGCPCSSRGGGPSGHPAHTRRAWAPPAEGRREAGHLQACPDWLELLFLHPHFPLLFLSSGKADREGGPGVAPWGGRQPGSVPVLALFSGQSHPQRDSALQGGLGHPSWPGPCRLGDSRMLQELALCPEAGHSRGSGAAAAHLSGVSGLRPPLTPRLILPAPSGHAPDLRADAGRTGEEGTRGQDRLDRTLLTFLTKNNKLHAGSPNLARDPQRGPGKAAPSPGPRVLTCEVGPTTAGLTSGPRPWQEGCMSPCGASTQTPVLGNSGRKEPDQRGEAPPGPTRSVTLC